MSVALFRSTLRIAIHDVLAQDAPAAPANPPGSEPAPILFEARQSRRVGHCNLVVHAGLGAAGKAS